MQFQNTFSKADIPPTGHNRPCSVSYAVMNGFDNSTLNLYVVLGIIRIGFSLMVTVVSLNSSKYRMVGMCNTSCFFSSSLSPTASLAAVARVLRVAWLSLATSIADRSVKSNTARFRLRTYPCWPLLRQWIRHLGWSQKAGWRRSYAR